MIINHNISALNTYRQLSINNMMAAKSLEKLSSGLRINRAGDDAAGLAISEKMRGQIRGLEMASKNAQDAISLIQTAEGALNETHSILQRMRELAVQSASDTNTEADRVELQKEVDQLAKELSRISNNTEFNTKNLLGGAFAGIFHIGANENQNLSLSINAMDAYTLGLTEDVASISAKVVSSTGDKLVGADIVGTQYLTEGNYTVEVAANATAGVDITLKDAEGNVIASKTGHTAAAGPVTLVDDSGTDVITLAYDAAMAAGETATIYIGASGADLTSGTNIVAVEVSAKDALADGTYTLTIKSSDGTKVDIAEITDSNGKVIATATYTSNLAVNSAYTISLSNGKTLTFTTGNNTPAIGNTATFTVVNTDYTSGTSSAAVDSNGDGVLDKEAVAVKGIDVRTQQNANTAITKIEAAIETVSAERSKLGAIQNRLEHTINNLGTASENLTAAESRIRDVDMAKEIMEFTKMNILQQAATAMLSQANQLPQAVLQLLR
ncbi:flagellin [Desulfofundulus australicus DSM 11792]|uniref:Flagellin n=1 Tax=Desulfofundulus australicus DSM 11792 TaxID=1121425 RepID=A0A1M4VSJ3_9FIRM|nr:flagellin [Desulfofundulus australicus]SHE71939.1 flagellin [Desulfofundulus australicus DSM 11792]